MKHEAFEAKLTQEFDLRNTQSIEESVRHSDVVYNLIGRNYPTKSV
jgi:NADH dehydrogenase (ubiquinone) 1 alpha subcomplex subunit 9